MYTYLMVTPFAKNTFMVTFAQTPGAQHMLSRNNSFYQATKLKTQKNSGKKCEIIPTHGS